MPSRNLLLRTRFYFAGLGALLSLLFGAGIIFAINASAQLAQEKYFLYGLGLAMVLLTWLITQAGLWLIRRVAAPLVDLAARIAASESGNPGPERNLSLDDVGELTLIFERYLDRIRGCAERERAFASDVSHELRTPLAVIRGALEILEDDMDLNDSQRNRIARIERASHDMTELTSALLSLSREENGLATGPDNCSIASVVRESVEKHRSLNGALTVDIDLNIVDAPLVPVEKGLATIVVDNLIGNAMLHAQSSQIRVCLERNRLAISDSGKGIAKADLDHIFKRHYRGPDSQGSGIGLSLVKRVCDLHGWEIVIDSAPGQGTSAQLFFGKKYVT
jgi:signal transduction histidine kinase